MTMPRDMAKMTVSGTPGTGTITLLAAATGFQTFAAANVPDGDTVSYAALDGANWEIGRGVYTAAGTTLTRGPIFSNNANAAISMTSAAVVWIAVLGEDLSLLSTLLVQAVNQVIPGSVYVADDYEIGATVDLEIGANGAFEIG